MCECWKPFWASKREIMGVFLMYVGLRLLVVPLLMVLMFGSYGALGVSRFVSF